LASTNESAHLSPAEEAFAEFLTLREDGPVDFEAFCAERPALERGLRRLHARWRVFDEAISADLQPGDLDRARAGDSTDRLLDDLRQQPDESRYLAREEIGRGGMGRVIKVWDKDLRRSLAMKVLAERRKNDARSLARFLDEAMITGQLEHPGIVPVHELGLDSDGRVYFTMPFVRGEDLQRIFDRVHAGDARWTSARALEVLLRVCEAVGYAHARGVVHRDLKPANIMVGPFGETYVMDWGLARILSNGAEPEADSARGVRSVRAEVDDGSDDSPFTTMEGDVVGTPVYMAPEQAHGWIERVGPATDVYSIGAMLYHLLGGRRPFLAPGEADSTEAVLRAVKSRPPRPLHALRADVPPELEAICDKAMAREASDRYADTMELAADLRAYLDQRVVAAYETGAVAELRKWVARNRRLAAALAAVFASVLIGLAVSTALFFVARRNESEALAEKTRADRTAAHLATELRTSNLAQGRLSAANGQFQRAEQILWREHLRQPTAQSRWLLWELYASYPQARVIAMPRLAHDAAITPDGAIALVTASDEYWSPTDLHVLDTRSLRTLARLPVGSGETHVAVESTGRRAVTAGSDGRVREWDLVTHRELRVLAELPSAVEALIFDGGREEWVLGRADGVVTRLTLDGSSTDLVAPAKVTALGLAPDGALLAIGTVGGAVLLQSTATGEIVRALEVEDGTVRVVAFDARGGRLFVSMLGGAVSVWDVASGELVERFASDNKSVNAICVVSDDVVALGGWYRLDLVDVPRLERRSIATPAPIHAVARSSSELLLIARNLGLASWDLASERQVRRLEGPDELMRIARAGDGRVVAATRTGDVRIWDPIADEVRAAWSEESTVHAVDFAPDGGLVAILAGDEAVIRSADDARVLGRVPAAAGASRQRLSFSPDAALLAAASGTEDEPFRLWRVDDGAQVARFGREGEEAIAVAVAPTGDRVATVTRTRRARDGAWLNWLSTWSLDGVEQERLNSPGVWRVAWSPDGRSLVAGQYAREPKVFDVEPLRVRTVLRGHTANVWAVAWHPSEPDLVASCSADGTLRLWDAEEGTNLLTIDADAGTLSSVSFADDGDTLAACGRSVFVWDLRYFDRHIAGNAAYQIERLRGELGANADGTDGADLEAAGIATVEAWVDEALARDWPTFAR